MSLALSKLELNVKKFISEEQFLQLVKFFGSVDEQAQIWIIQDIEDDPAHFSKGFFSTVFSRKNLFELPVEGDSAEHKVDDAISTVSFDESVKTALTKIFNEN
jgi:hypothetical protein